MCASRAKSQLTWLQRRRVATVTTGRSCLVRDVCGLQIITARCVAFFSPVPQRPPQPRWLPLRDSSCERRQQCPLPRRPLRCAHPTRSSSSTSPRPAARRSRRGACITASPGADAGSRRADPVGQRTPASLAPTRGAARASTSHRSHGRRRTRRPSPPAPPPSASSATLSRAPSQSIPGKPSGRRTGAPARSMVKVPVLAVPQLGSCAFSGRVWRLRAARDTHGERPGHWAPSYCLRCSSEPPQSRPFYCF